MSAVLAPIQFPNPFPVPTLEEQLTSIEEDGRETLYICPDAWALRHRFVHKETGEMIRARCDSWRCLYCGPRKVDQWRQLVKQAEPRLFVTLTKVGWTVEEASRVLTTVLQRLRRGFKSQDPERKGFREAYPVEYFAVLERHDNFEENGFHWHLLVKGVDFLPKQVVSDALWSATKGRAYIVDVQRVRNATAVGYVTKYLTKSITQGEQGVREEQREMVVLGLEVVEQAPEYDEEGNLLREERPSLYRIRRDEQGNPVEEKTMCLVEVKSKARRIRYSRRFFPASVADLRAKLFAGIEDAGEIAIDEAAAPVEPVQASDHEIHALVVRSIDEVAIPVEPMQEESQQQEEEKQQEEEETGSAWTLVEVASFTRDIRVYRRRKQEALREAVEDRRASGRRLSRRLVNMHYYQQCEQRERRWAS